MRLLAPSLAIILGMFLPSMGFATDGKQILETGKRVYEEHCGVCHGLLGDGQGMAAHMFQTPARDFREGKYKFRSTPSGSLPLDSDLVRSVKSGVRGTAMVPQDHLSDEEIGAVVQYIKSFAERFSLEKPEAPVPIPAPPPKTSTLVASGRAIYKKAGCPECHGEGGEGDGPSAPDLRIKPADLTQRPLKGGATPQDLYRTLMTGLDGTPMPSYKDVLEEEEFWALVFFIESLGGRETVTEEERIGRHVEEMHQPRRGPIIRGSPLRPLQEGLDKDQRKER
ncbi:MAG: c-type cytochrome [Candidatus Methylomirabilales bacterium]